MAGIPRRWDEGPSEGEDPSIDVPAASLARVTIRSDQRRYGRRKTGDLTFDPTTVNDDPDADLFASRRRGGSGEAARGARNGSPAVLGAATIQGTRRAKEAAQQAPGPAVLLGGAGAIAKGAGQAEQDREDGAPASPPADWRAALAQVKPAVRRRNPLIALADGQETPVPQDEGKDAHAPGMNGRAHADCDAMSRPAEPAPETAAPPAPEAPAPPAPEVRSGWRSTFSRWRRKIAFAAETPEPGSGTELGKSQLEAPTPSRSSNLYDYWSQLRRGRKMPGWSEIRMDEVARVWPNSFVVSFEPKADSAAPPLVRARRVTQDNGVGSTAEDLRLTDTVIEWILATARAAVKHGEPVQDRESFVMHDGKTVYTIVAVPFTGEHAGTEHILCHIKPLARPGATRRAG